ncbi:MAG: DUF2628 domain-containing protein [Pseudomonadales bacterium]
MSETNNDLYTEVIGPRNTNYYLTYFKRADARGYAPISWHWPVVFADVFWFLYRKQYRWAAIVTLVSLLILVVAGQISRMGYPELGVTVQLVLLAVFKLVYVPLRANALYYNWVQHRIRLVQTALPGNSTEQKSMLAKLGGTSFTTPLMIVALLFLVAGLLPTQG